MDMPSLMVSAWAKADAANKAIAKPALIDIAFLIGAFIVSSGRVRMAHAPDPYELESSPQKRVKLDFALVPYPGIVAGAADMPNSRRTSYRERRGWPAIDDILGRRATRAEYASRSP